MPKSERARLQHMLDAARDAVAFMQGRSRADLDSDKMLMLAITRLLEIIGEAARGVSSATRDAHPQVPWRQIAGTRDRLIHAYVDVDLNIVWDIVANDLPPLIRRLEGMLQT